MDTVSLSRTFSERIRKLRTERGMNQGQFADFVGVSRGAMSYYEQEARTPDIAVLKSICEKCGVSADYVLGLIPDQDRAVSDVCLETGLLPKAVKRLKIIKRIRSIQVLNMKETIRKEFDDQDEAMKLSIFTSAPDMVNLLLGTDEGLQVLLMLCAVIVNAELYSNGEKVENPEIFFPQAHSYLAVSFQFTNVSDALWVKLQENVAKLRDFVHGHEAFREYFEYHEGRQSTSGC